MTCGAAVPPALPIFRHHAGLLWSKPNGFCRLRLASMHDEAWELKFAEIRGLGDGIDCAIHAGWNSGKGEKRVGNQSLF